MGVPSSIFRTWAPILRMRPSGTERPMGAPVGAVVDSRYRARSERRIARAPGGLSGLSAVDVAKARRFSASCTWRSACRRCESGRDDGGENRGTVAATLWPFRSDRGPIVEAVGQGPPVPRRTGMARIGLAAGHGRSPFAGAVPSRWGWPCAQARGGGANVSGCDRHALARVRARAGQGPCSRAVSTRCQSATPFIPVSRPGQSARSARAGQAHEIMRGPRKSGMISSAEHNASGR